MSTAYVAYLENEKRSPSATVIARHLEVHSAMKPRRAAVWRTMDLIVAKWFIYVVIGLAVAYLWVHSNAPE